MKIGFACKYVHPDRTISDKQIREIEKAHNQTTTTAKWMRDNPKLAEERIWFIVEHNMSSLRKLVEYVATLPKALQMVRIGSELLPLYTHADHQHLYDDQSLVKLIETSLKQIGNLARKHDIKMSFHPGQFCVLASDKPDVVVNSINEFEYHAYMARCMGYGKSKLDFKCNVHLSGRGGAEEFRRTYKKLSPTARNIITLENDEFSSCLDDLIPLRDLVGIVLDVHHYWIHQEEYIHRLDPRLDYVEESWGDRRPTIHYSYSRHDYVASIRGRKPDIHELIEQGHPKSRLRAHSDYYPNPVMNNYVLEMLPRFDIMCEAKAKNLAAFDLYAQGRVIGLLD